jgi:hypothetical protein
MQPSLPLRLLPVHEQAVVILLRVRRVPRELGLEDVRGQAQERGHHDREGLDGEAATIRLGSRGAQRLFLLHLARGYVGASRRQIEAMISRRICVRQKTQLAP